MGAVMSCKKGEDSPPNGISIGHVDEYVENVMKLVPVGDEGDEVVVVKHEDNFYAFGTKCPHYGANLITGVFHNGKVRCPWHGACFSAKTGDIEDYPGLEGIPTFNVNKTDNGDLTIAASSQQVKMKSILRPLGKLCSGIKIADPRNNFNTLPGVQTFVIIGAGAAGFICAVTLRQNKFDGRIVMITSDSFLPYDRTKITKSLDSDWEAIKLQSKEFYEEHNIECLLDATVEKIEFQDKKIKLIDDDRIVQYNSLMISTGLKPRKQTFEGIDLKNIHTIYSLKDTQRVKALAANKTVVIAGSSFIALELASSLDDVASTITVISRSKWPYGIVFGETVGSCMLKLLIKNSKNVVYESPDEIKSFEGNSDGEVTSVVTVKNKVYICDVVVLAMGGIPSTEFLQDSEINLVNDNVVVDEYLQTTVENVFAAGDIATFPSTISVSGHATIGHWGMAQKHGRIGALSMLGMKTSISNSVPFFWTRIWGLTVRYCGNGHHYNETLVFGDMEEMKFCVLYRRDGILLSVLTVNCDPIAARLSFDLENHIIYKKDEFPSYITDVFPNPPTKGTIPSSKYESLPGAADFALGLN